MSWMIFAFSKESLTNKSLLNTDVSGILRTRRELASKVVTVCVDALW